MKKLALLAVAGLGGCVVQAPPERIYVHTPPRVVYQQPPSPPTYYPENGQQQAPEQVVSAYVEPPLVQPEPILVEWAPPPMLVEVPPPQPYEAAVWTGGYWVWQGNWIWAHGRWAAPPQFGYCWVHPYYENRGGAVVFVNGFWAAPGVHFIQPSLQIHLTFATVNPGVIRGPRPIGPDGVFIPAPPGSVRGLIVPAPIGTSPAVVTGAPPIVREGMRVHIENNSNNTVINHNTTIVNNVTIIAPPGSTANGQAVNRSIPAQAHLAAQMPPVVRAMAPEPTSNRPIPSYSPGHGQVNLPAPQPVHFNNQAAPSPVSAPMPAPTPQYGQVPQHGQPPSVPTPATMPAQPHPAAPSGISVQQHPATPVAPEHYQPQQQQQQNYNPPPQYRPNEGTPTPAPQRPVSMPAYPEIKPVQNVPVNEMRMRQEPERNANPAQIPAAKGPAREDKEKLKEHEHER